MTMFTRDHSQCTPITVPITSYQQVYFGNGFKALLLEALFPYNQTAGSPIFAIKAVRAELGIGLKEAKSIVDNLTPQLLGGRADDTRVSAAALNAEFPRAALYDAKRAELNHRLSEAAEADRALAEAFESRG